MRKRQEGASRCGASVSTFSLQSRRVPPVQSRRQREPKCYECREIASAVRVDRFACEKELVRWTNCSPKISTPPQFYWAARSTTTCTRIFGRNWTLQKKKA